MSGWRARLGLTAAALALAFALALAGCGSTTELVTLEQGAIGTVLVSAGELSPDAEPTDDSPEPCSPIPIFEERATEAATTRTFLLGETRLKEAVGYFAGEERANAAFERLAGEERSECIRESIEKFNEGAEVEVEALEPLGLSDPEWLARYAVQRPGEDAEKSVDVAAFRLGLCVATVIVFQEDGSAEAARELFEVSAQPAAATCQ